MFWQPMRDERFGDDSPGRRGECHHSVAATGGLLHSPDGYGSNRIRIFPMNINESTSERSHFRTLGEGGRSTLRDGFGDCSLLFAFSKFGEFSCELWATPCWSTGKLQLMNGDDVGGTNWIAIEARKIYSI